jgi:hypothetical protein
MFETGKRYSGYFDFETKCPVIGDINVFMKIPILFSFKVVEIDESSLCISDVNPIAVNKLLLDNQIVFLVKENFREKFIAKVNITEGISFQILKTVMDKRKDFRYKFCPSFAGSFELYKDGILISRHIFLESLSFSGLSSFLFLNEVKTSPGDVLLFVQDKKRFKVSVVAIEQRSGLFFLRGRIVDSNVNIFKLNVDLYVRTFKQIMSFAGVKVEG